MSVYKAIVKPLQHYIKFPKIWIDNTVMRLHAKLTVLILFTGCMLTSVGQFFGKPIDCIVSGAKVPKGVMNTYCWIHSTFSLPKNISMNVGTQEAMYGQQGIGTYDEDDEVYENKYYQWVCYTLLIQGLFFLIPYQLWKRWEGGKVSSIIPRDLTHTVNDKRMPVFATPAKLIPQKKMQVAVAVMKDYFIRDNNYIEHRYYLHKFAFCELLNFCNVLFQIYFLNVFLGGVFTTYGSDVIAMSQEDPDKRNDPMDRIFPKVAKCDFRWYGGSGTIQNADGQCILPLNIINEKIYIIVWFWFVTLAIVTGVQLAWRVCTLASRRVREQFLRGKSYMLTNNSDVTTVCNNITLGDWFILILISENIDTRVFSELIRQLSKTFSKMMDESHVTFDTAV